MAQGVSSRASILLVGPLTDLDDETTLRGRADSRHPRVTETSPMPVDTDADLAVRVKSRVDRSGKGTKRCWHGGETAARWR